MKIFDMHIGLSDSIVQFNKNSLVEGNPNGKFPNQFDFIRAKKGKLEIFGGFICPIEFNGNTISLPSNQEKEIMKHIQAYNNLEQQGMLTIVRKNSDFSSSGIKVILGLEGAYFLKTEDDFELLFNLLEQGIKIIGPKWNFSNALFNKKNKLTGLGQKFLSICEENKMIIDLAHTENDVIEEILTNYNGNVINSHTCLFSIYNSKRNIKDEYITEIVKREGIVALNFVGEFVGGNTVQNLIEHIDYFINNFGVANLAIGSDYDGMEDSDLIASLEDVSKYNNLVTDLKTIGLTINEVEKMMFKNAYSYFVRNI